MIYLFDTNFLAIIFNNTFIVKSHFKKKFAFIKVEIIFSVAYEPLVITVLQNLILRMSCLKLFL